MGARELLHDLTGAGFSLVADGDKLVIRPASKLTDELRAAVRQAKPELMDLLTERPYRLSRAEGDAAHAEPWDDTAISRFVARVSLFLRRRIDATDADDLAERLHLRDVQGDDRVLCVECAHLRGRPGAWACGNHVAADVGRDLAGDLVTTMQRCAGFAP